MAKCLDRNENGGDEHGETDDQPRDSIRCDVEGRDKKPEEEKRGSQIALEDKNRHTDKPHDQDRTQITSAWKTQSQHLRAADGQIIAVSDQVTGEENRQSNLHKLARLHRQRAEADPHSCSVGFLAEAGNHRKQEQNNRNQAKSVGVAAKNTVITHQHQDRRGKDDGDSNEHQLSDTDGVHA